MRAPDGEVEAAAGSSLAQPIFVQPVEIRMIVARGPFAQRNCDRVDMRAVSLRTLQNAHMAQRACGGERRDQVGEHPAVARNQFIIAPPGNKACGFGNRSINQMCYWRDIRQQPPARLFVVQIDWQMRKPAVIRNHRRSAGQGDHLPIG